MVERWILVYYPIPGDASAYPRVCYQNSVYLSETRIFATHEKIAKQPWTLTVGMSTVYPATVVNGGR